MMRAFVAIALAALLAGGCASAPPPVAVAIADNDSLEAIAREQGSDEASVEVDSASEGSRGRGVVATVVGGDRQLVDVGVGAPLADVRYRSVDGGSVGYVRARARSAHVIVGRARIRAGENVLLGRTFSAIPLSRAGVMPSFEVVPTASLWYGQTVVAADVRLDGWQATAVGLSPSPQGGRWGGAESAWVSLARQTPTRVLGVAAGWRTSARAPRAVTTFADFVRGGVRVATEVAMVGRGGFGALRVATLGGRASVRFFKMPDDPGTSEFASQLRSPFRTMAGVTAAARAKPFLGMSIAGTLAAVERRSLSSTRRTTRVSLFARRRLSPHADADMEVVALDDETIAISNDPILDAAAVDTGQRFSMRWQLRLRANRAMTHQIRLVLSRDADGASGATLTVGSTGQWGRLGADWRLSGYALDPGVRSYISRPGVATFEHVSAVFGHGSDASLRVRLRIRPRSTLIGFASTSSSRPGRFYVAIDLRL